MSKVISALLFVLLLAPVARAQTGEINLLTDIGTPFPPGCITQKLPVAPASDDNELVDTDISVPSINSDELDSDVRVVIWRVGCPDEDFSVVMVRLEDISEDQPILVPQAFVRAGQEEGPDHQAQLIPLPAIGNVGASGSFQEIPTDGVTYMLAVEPCPLQDECDENTPVEDLFFPEQYNDLFTLELDWRDYSNNSTALATFEVIEFDPGFDPLQFDEPVFNGRHTGNYRVQNHPRTGLMLQVAEFKPGDALAEENFIFAIFFTYTNDGEQLWITGNTGPEEPGPVSELELEMFKPEGGLFFTSPTGSFDSDDVDMVPVGTLTLRVVDCNNLEGDFDFTEGGFGSGSLEFQRLIRIAGYDCNPWE